MSEKTPIVNVTQIHRGCGSGCGSGCALIILATIAMGLLGPYFYHRSKTSPPESAQPTPASSPPPAEPLPTPLPLPTPEPLPPASQAVNEAKRLAVKYHPDLGVAGSPLNKEFVARYKRYQTEKPAFFDNPSWPLALTEECVQALRAKK
jgi:hypothetical protein